MPFFNLRRLLSLPPAVVMRVSLDLGLIGSWVWLASDSLPQPLPALGAAVFGAVSAGYWAFQNKGMGLSTAESEIPRHDEGLELGRLARFTNRPPPEPATVGSEEWFNDPEVMNRMRAEADRCSELGIPMAVIFLRAQPGSLADWAVGPPGASLSEILPSLLDGAQHKHKTSVSGREAVIACVGGDRASAEELLQRLREQLKPAEYEAGIVVYPEEGVDPAALASLARLRLQHVGNSNSSSRHAGMDPVHIQSRQGRPPAQDAALDRPGRSERAS